MPTPNLALPYIATSQAQKEVTHNEAIAALDGAITAPLTVNSGSLPSITAADWRTHAALIVTGSGGVVTVPAIPKAMIVVGQHTGSVTVSMSGGGTSATFPAGESGLVYCTGSGVVRIT